MLTFPQCRYALWCIPAAVSLLLRNSLFERPHRRHLIMGVSLADGTGPLTDWIWNCDTKTTVLPVAALCWNSPAGRKPCGWWECSTVCGTAWESSLALPAAFLLCGLPKTQRCSRHNEEPSGREKQIWKMDGCNPVTRSLRKYSLSQMCMCYAEQKITAGNTPQSRDISTCRVLALVPSLKQDLFLWWMNASLFKPVPARDEN